LLTPSVISACTPVQGTTWGGPVLAHPERTNFAAVIQRSHDQRDSRQWQAHDQRHGCAPQYSNLAPPGAETIKQIAQPPRTALGKQGGKMAKRKPRDLSFTETESSDS